MRALESATAKDGLVQEDNKRRRAISHEWNTGTPDLAFGIH
jgi:hypothetical protein